jgi:hypothetical protein
MTNEKRCRCGRLARCCDEWECLLSEFDESSQHMLNDVEVEEMTEVSLSERGFGTSDDGGKS